MGTGVTASLINGYPYQARWLHYIAYILFALDAFLFILFLIISVVRYIRWPVLLRLLLRHPAQSMFIGAFAMGFTTIVNLSVITIGPSWGQGFSLFVWAMWWVSAIISMAVAIGMPILQFTRHTHLLQTITGVMILPVVAPIVAGAAGANMVNMLPPSHARLSIVVSYIMVGSGFGLAMLTIGMFYARLTIHKIPPAALVVTIFLPLGPCGQAAFALLRLSSALLQITETSGSAFVGLSMATPMDARIMALGVNGMSIALALMIWGLGLAWVIIAVGLLTDLWIVSKLNFNLGWWGFIFPVGTFCLATNQLALEFDSEAFRVLGALFTMAEILLWLTIAATTTYRAVQGQIFVSPCLAEVNGRPPQKGLLARQYEYEPRSPLPAAPPPALPRPSSHWPPSARTLR